MHQCHYFLQQQLAVHAFPLVGRVGEKMADIPQRQAAQQGVAKGVDGHVAV